VLAAEHLLRLGGVDLALERLQRIAELGADVLARGRPFDQDAQVVAAFLQ